MSDLIDSTTQLIDIDPVESVLVIETSTNTETDTETNTTIDIQTDTQTDTQTETDTETFNEMDKTEDCIVPSSLEQEESDSNMIAEEDVVLDCYVDYIDPTLLEIDSEIEDLLLLFSSTVLRSLVEDIIKMDSAPNFEIVSHITNRSLTFKCENICVLDDIDACELLKDTNTKIRWMARYADLITRSNYNTEWYKQQITNISNITQTDKKSVIITFDCLANIAFMAMYSDEPELKENSLIAFDQLYIKALQELKEYKQKVMMFMELEKDMQETEPNTTPESTTE